MVHRDLYKQRYLELGRAGWQVTQVRHELRQKAGNNTGFGILSKLTPLRNLAGSVASRTVHGPNAY